MDKRGAWALAVALGCAVAANHRLAAFPLDGKQTLLPASTELDEDALVKPREAFHSELNHGHKSYVVDLGDLGLQFAVAVGWRSSPGRNEKDRLRR